jgi:hypothetical protein
MATTTKIIDLFVKSNYGLWAVENKNEFDDGSSSFSLHNNKTSLQPEKEIFNHGKR